MLYYIDEFTQMIIDTPLKEVIGNQMWPTTAVTPEALNMVDTTGQNPLDFIADVAMRKPEQFAKANRNKK
jgi:hypothetical protein